MWIRWGGAPVGAALALGQQARLWFEPGSAGNTFWLISLLVHDLLLYLFLWNTGHYPARHPRQTAVLALQTVLQIPINPDFGILNAIAVPLICPPGQRLRWLQAQVATIPFSLAFLFWRQWSLIQREVDAKGLWTRFGVELGFSLVEHAAWILLAYLAAVALVQMEQDRRHLAIVNAELISSRTMLAESSRMAERVEIARELHDSLGHHLTTLNLELELARRVPADERDGHIMQAQLLARLLLADLRDHVSGWRRGAHAGLPEALGALASSIPGVQIEVKVEEGFTPIDTGRAHALLRCAQEAVTNSLRHGSATKIEITLRSDAETIVLAVRDNGPGCAALTPGNGLAGIAERVEGFGGRARYDSPPEGGFHLEVRLPFMVTGAVA